MVGWVGGWVGFVTYLQSTRETVVLAVPMPTADLAAGLDGVVGVPGAECL